MSYGEMQWRFFRDNVIKLSRNGPYPQKFCFVLGAGASISSGIPSGQRFVRLWEMELCKKYGEQEHSAWKKKMGITANNQSNFYSTYYERRFPDPQEGQTYLKQWMGRAHPSAGYFALGYLLTQTPHNVVVTTNFDHLTENTVELYYNEIPLVIGHELLTRFISIEEKGAVVLKIHRDILFDPQNTNKDTKALGKAWKPALASIFSRYHPIFIGYAGNDKSLMDFLLEHSKNFSGKAAERWKKPYWLSYGASPLEEPVRNFLEQAEGYLIQSKGFDSVLTQIAVRLPPEPPFVGEENLQEAQELYQRLVEKYPEALQTDPREEPQKVDADFIRAVSRITEHGGALRTYQKSISLYNRGEYAAALPLMQRLVKMEPNNAYYRFSLGNAFFCLKRYEEAVTEEQKAVELEPDNAEYHYVLGVTFQRMKCYKESLAEVQKAVELEPSVAEYHNALGEIFRWRERYEEAAAEWRKAVKLEPNTARYHNSLGKVLQKLTRYEEAVIEGMEAVRLDPGNAKYHESLGVGFLRARRYEEAIAEGKKAVELEDNPFYHNSLGVTYFWIKHYEEAIVEWNRAVELCSGVAEFHNSLGEALKRLKRYEEAVEEWKKAVELEPNNVKYHYALSLVLDILGRSDEALAERQKAFQLKEKTTKRNEKVKNG